MSEFQSDITDKKYDEEGNELDKHGFKVKKYPDGLESVIVMGGIPSKTGASVKPIAQIVDKLSRKWR